MAVLKTLEIISESQGESFYICSDWEVYSCALTRDR
jgi:hypothetical protein